MGRDLRRLICSSFVWIIGGKEEEDQCLSIHASGGGEPLIPRDETGGNGCQPGLNLFATHQCLAACQGTKQSIRVPIITTLGFIMWRKKSKVIVYLA